MLKKLKRKFVIINMCLVGIVLLIVFSAACINTYKQSMEEVDGALIMALEKTGEEKPEPFEIGTIPGNRDRFTQPVREKSPMGGKPFNYAAVVALVKDVEGERQITILGMENASMNEEVMADAVKTAMDAEEAKGKLDEMGLFFMKDEGAYGTKIAFADSTYFEASVRKTLLTSVVLFLLGMTALFMISLLLAKIAVEPVKKAWQQQRRFVADASHELKTPLTVILANSEIMMSELAADDLREHPKCGGDGKESMRKWLESSQEEANHMKALVDDLLFLARADEAEGAKAVLPEKINMDISEMITGIVLQMEPVVYEGGAVLESNIEEGIHMKCDPTQMRQLMHILMDNAVKYCDSPGRIYLELSRKNKNIQLTVANTGSVIDSEDLEHIFDRFYRSDKARSGSGYGLGLSIARTIVEGHGGTIKALSGNLDGDCGWCPSEGRTGTVMTAEFPMV